MISSLHKYKWELNGVRIYPTYQKGTTISYTKESGRVFFRLRLNGKLTILRGDFNNIWNNTLSTKFTLICSRLKWSTQTYTEYFRCEFYKTDANQFHEDREIVELTPESVDRYKKILDAIDRELDLVKDLSPQPYKVNYVKEPLIQIAFPFHETMFNKCGHATFVSELGTTYTPSQLQDFGFQEHSTIKLYIPGNGDMTPDVSGYYEKTGSAIYERQDGIYRILRNVSVPHDKWSIFEVATDTKVFDSLATQSLEERNPFDQIEFSSDYSNVLQSVSDPDVYCSVFPIRPHQRVLTDQDSIGGTPTIPLPDGDIGGLKFNYKNYVDTSGGDALFALVNVSDNHTTTPLELGRFNDKSLHFAGEYFNPPLLNSLSGYRRYPVLLNDWTEYGLFMDINSAMIDDLYEANTTLTLNHAYKLTDVVIQALSILDDTVSYNDDTAHSRFLNSNPNPLTGDPNGFTHFITPKSNILTSTYNNAATKAPIKLRDIEELLMNKMQAYWYIDNSHRFCIEHIQYYNNGKSYTDEVVSEDLTILIDPKTGKHWSHRSRKYGYKKESMAQFIESAWMDVTSVVFDGYKIENISPFVKLGETDDKRVTLFTSDITMGLAGADTVSKEGFFVFNADIVEGQFTIPFVAVDLGDGLPPEVAQNGFWSNINLHENFWKHNASSDSIRLNNVIIEPLSSRRARPHEVIIPSPIEPDPMRLITSSIGTDQVEVMEVNLTSRSNKITLLANLDFDAPG